MCTSKELRKSFRAALMIACIIVLTVVHPSYLQASTANVVVSLPISQGTVSISAPSAFTFSAINVSYDAQTITSDFTGVANYLIVSDLKGSDSGYTTTLQLTGDLVSTGGNSIASGNVYVKSDGPTGILFSGSANPRVIIDSAITGGFLPLNNTRTFIYRSTFLNTGVLSSYAQNISMQIQVPATQQPGNYVGVLVYTIIEN